MSVRDNVLLELADRDPETLTVAQRKLLEEARARKLLPEKFKPLWGEGFQTLDAETCYKFIITHVKTFEQASGQDLAVPDKAYLRELCDEWFECFHSGTPLHIVKSRRLIVSWFCSAIELFVAGLRRGRFCIAAATYEGLNGSQQFVHRVYYLYDGLVKENPSWRLKPLTEKDYTGNPKKEYLSKMVLPNGSTFEAVNSDGDSFQGGGVTVARIEELSKQAKINTIWGQALFVTQGIPGQQSGFAYSISNASSNAEYLELIRNV